MKKIFTKAKAFLKRISKGFKNDCQFSFLLAIYRLTGDICSHLHLKALSKRAYKAKDEWILSYLKKRLKDVIDYINSNPDTGVFTENAPIWVCWWTGEETAPALVKRCIRSIRENAKNHPVHLIDQNSFSEFLDIPEFILDKVKTNKICIANFSDYLRVSLINAYGGFWIDSTVFCSALLPDDYFNLSFFTCKSPEEECGYISKMRWTSFIMAGWKNNMFFTYMHKCFLAYWESHEYAIDYLLVDYLIELAYREIPAIKEQIDNVPLNNLHRDDLQNAMYQAVSGEEFNNVIKEDTVLYKLSWRESFPIVSSNNNESIYSYFIKG